MMQTLKELQHETRKLLPPDRRDMRYRIWVHHAGIGEHLERPWPVYVGVVRRNRDVVVASPGLSKKGALAALRAQLLAWPCPLVGAENWESLQSPLVVYGLVIAFDDRGHLQAKRYVRDSDTIV